MTFYIKNLHQNYSITLKLIFYYLFNYIILIYNNNTMKKNKNQRTRNWPIIVYPESAPENWIDILQKEYVKMVVSPLHDKDVNPDDTLKKAHYHVLFMFDGVKSYNQVKSIADSVNAPIPQIVGSAKGLTRYMLHLDNPDKAQYDSSDLQAFN